MSRSRILDSFILSFWISLELNSGLHGTKFSALSIFPYSSYERGRCLHISGASSNSKPKSRKKTTNLLSMYAHSWSIYSDFLALYVLTFRRIFNLMLIERCTASSNPLWRLFHAGWYRICELMDGMFSMELLLSNIFLKGQGIRTRMFSSRTNENSTLDYDSCRCYGVSGEKISWPASRSEIDPPLGGWFAHQLTRFRGSQQNRLELYIYIE